MATDDASFTIRQVVPGEEVNTTVEPATDAHLGDDSDGIQEQSKEAEKKKSRKPSDNKWFQQKIPACRPVWTTKHVVGLFVIVGVAFIGLGIGFLVTTIRLKNVRVEYTDCAPINPSEVNNAATCEQYLYQQANLSNLEREAMNEPRCKCNVSFDIPDDMNTPVFMYYSLHNYFQNHRRFVNSWSGDQLRSTNLLSTGTCDPLERDSNTSSVFLPCGIIGNSFFNDTLNITSQNVSLVLDRTAISWRSDRDVRFQNNDGNETENIMGRNVQPKNWQQDISQLPNSLQNEDLIVWYRVSAFPNFLKLYARIRVDNRDVIPAGKYALQVDYNYPVTRFGGSKYLVLSEDSWLGGRNHFLGIAYIIVGVLTLIAAVVLLIVRLKFSRWNLDDADYLHRQH